MNKHAIGPLEFFTFEVFEKYKNVSCCAITRKGGLSGGAFESLNLGLRSGDDPVAVRDNRAQLSLITNAFPDLLTFGRQVHDKNVAVVNGADIGRGATDIETAIPDTDAMVTDIPDVPLVVLLADCCSISLFDPVNNAVGMVHAGWRGTVAGIAAVAVRKMVGEYGSDPADIVAGIGPSIGACCYDVGEEVVDQFNDEFPDLVAAVVQRSEGQKPHFDLQQANRLILMTAGIQEGHIEGAGMCTSCRTDVFFSHRAENGNTGRFGTLIMLHDRTRRAY
jgi:YfiH family protein